MAAQEAVVLPPELLAPVEAGPDAAADGAVLEAAGNGADGAGPASGAAAAPPAETSACLKLKGLPYAVSEAQIVEFFAGFAVKSVAFVFEPDGRPSGLVRGWSGRRMYWRLCTTRCTQHRRAPRPGTPPRGCPSRRLVRGRDATRTLRLER
jgi:hypothetical protein